MATTLGLTAITSNELRFSALAEAGNIGAGNAMTAFATLMEQRITMTVPTADVVPISEFTEVVSSADEVAVGIVMQISGGLSGQIACLWPEESALCLANRLTAHPDSETRFLDELGTSALMELGNILASAYLSAISNMTGLPLQLSPPAFALDISAAILSAIACEVAFADDEAFVIITQTGRVTNSAGGFFVFVPDSRSLPVILRALQVEC